MPFVCQEKYPTAEQQAISLTAAIKKDPTMSFGRDSLRYYLFATAYKTYSKV
jgi:hypothetical protein